MTSFPALDIAQALIRCASVTPEDAGAQAVLKNILGEAGFRIFDLPFEGRNSYPVQNFFARYGTQGPHLCFAGHTDVVPPGDETAWSVPPFSATVKDGLLTGRGASDMKGNIACFVATCLSFLKDRPDFQGSISFIITGDEEKLAVNGTERVLEWMANNNHLPDVCLVGEPSNPDFLGQEIKIGRRGSLSGELTVHGIQGHVAYPDQADNPLPRLIKMLDVLSSTVFDMGSAFFPQTRLQVTSIDVGNTAGNVIPSKGTAAFNIRFSDRWTGEKLEAKVRALLDSVSKDYEISFFRNAESFLTSPGEWTNLVAGAVEQQTGHKPALTTGGGTSDARFVSRYCPVVEFGLINETIHQVDEHCSVANLELLTLVYHEILKRYFV